MHTETHRNRVARTNRLFTSPEAVEIRSSDDDLLRESYELGYLDHVLQGWKHLEDRGVDGRTKKPHKTFGLATDDVIELGDDERLQMQINEVQNALSGSVDVPEQFRQIDDNERAYILGLIKKHVAKGSVSSVGNLGTTGRVYPTDHPLAGQKIPVNQTPDERYARGEKLVLDVAGMVDPDTNAQLTGNELDAMHRQPAAEYPELVAAISNIKMGPNSMNQSDGRREGEDVQASRQSRLQNLQDERFFLENGVRNKQRGGIDKQTLADNRIAASMSPEELEVERDTRMVDQLAQEVLDNHINKVKQPVSAAEESIVTMDEPEDVDFMSETRMAGDKLRAVGDTDRNRGKVNKFVVNTEGGDFHLDTRMDKRDSSGRN